MKKFLIYLCAFALLFSLVSCKQRVVLPQASQLPQASAQMLAEKTQGTAVQAPSLPAFHLSPYAPSSLPVIPWKQFYQNYSDVSSAAYLRLTGALEGLSNLVYLQDAFRWIEGDITGALSATMLSGNPQKVKSMFTLLKYENVEYREDDDQNAVVICSGQDKPNMQYDLHYCVQDRTALLTFYENGNCKEILSWCVTDAYCAKTYYRVQDHYYLQTLCLKSGEVALSWENREEDLSLYQNAALVCEEGFALSLSGGYLCLIDNALMGSAKNTEK